MYVRMKIIRHIIPLILSKVPIESQAVFCLKICGMLQPNTIAIYFMWL